MGRGVSSGGGQSSLGYLFGSDEVPKPASNPPPAAASVAVAAASVAVATDNHASAEKPAGDSPPAGISKQIPAGIQGNPTNNYFRTDGQNTGNFITERPSTKVHAAPGGGSSLGYLFGDGSK